MEPDKRAEAPDRLTRMGAVVSKNVELVKRSFEAISAWDLDALPGLYDPDVEFLPLTGTRVETGGYWGQMAVLVKPNGLFGAAYMVAIKPFRYLIVYPALMRLIGREWRERVDRIGTENGEPR